MHKRRYKLYQPREYKYLLSFSKQEKDILENLQRLLGKSKATILIEALLHYAQEG